MSADRFDREKAGASVVGWMLLGLLVLSGAAYAVAGLAASDRLPRGTQVAGVHVGGLTPAQARGRLSADFPDRTATVTVGTRTMTVNSDAVGLSLDVDASIEQATGSSSWDPARLWNYYTGGDDYPAVARVDQTRMDQWLSAIAESVGRPARDGRISFHQARVRVVAPEDGQGIDPVAGRQALLASFVTGETAAIPLTRLTPSVDQRAVRRAVRTYANPAMSGPVTLDFGSTRVQLTPAMYADALTLRPHDGRLVPEVRARPLMQAVGSLASVAGAPVDATFRVVDGRPEVVRATPGTRYRPADVVDALLSVITQPEGSRVVQVHGVPDPAGFTTRDARRLGIVQRVSTYTTRTSDARTQRLAARVDGTVLEPGETFSLRRVVGAAAGDDLTTGLFNAMYRAGLVALEHHARGSFRPGAPDGMDATVADGGDLRFRNDTRKGVLVTASVDGRELHVSLYSTPRWDVRITTGDRTHLVKPKRRVDHSRGCRPSDGSPGFDVEVTRAFRTPGTSAVDHSDGFSVHYIPQPQVVCTTRK
jgi:vancomycin resistance protein YoaR